MRDKTERKASKRFFSISHETTIRLFSYTNIGCHPVFFDAYLTFFICENEGKSEGF
jgi:hypothetical protein